IRRWRAAHPIVCVRRRPASGWQSAPMSIGCSARASIPSRASGPASARCAKPKPTARRGWNWPANGRWRPARCRRATSSSCSARIGASPSSALHLTTAWANTSTSAAPNTMSTEGKIMLHQTVEKLRTLRLSGMAWALEAQLAQADIGRLSFDERLAMLIEREEIDRHNAALAQRLRLARLREAACFEDIDYRKPRGLDRALLQTLVAGRWLAEHNNVLILGKPAQAKASWLAH